MPDTSSNHFAQYFFPWDTMAQAHTLHKLCLAAPQAAGEGDASTPLAGISDIYR